MRPFLMPVTMDKIEQIGWLLQLWQHNIYNIIDDIIKQWIWDI